VRKMNCIESLHKAYILTWIGDYKTSSELARECIQLLSDSVKIRRKVKEVLKKADREYKVSKKLREEGVTTTDLIQVALYYLAKRLSVKKDNDIEIIEKGNIKLSVIENSLVKEVRGYCEGCKGYKYSLLNKAKGYLILYDEIIYAEFFEGNKYDVIDEILKNTKL